MFEKENLLKTVDVIRQYRDALSPEKEYLFGAILSYIYTAILIDPGVFPERVQPMVHLMKELPNVTPEIWVSVFFGLLITADGARRISFERLLLYKAYFQVFLLNQDEHVDLN